MRILIYLLLMLFFLRIGSNPVKEKERKEECLCYTQAYCHYDVDLQDSVFNIECFAHKARSGSLSNTYIPIKTANNIVTPHLFKSRILITNICSDIGIPLLFNTSSNRRNIYYHSCLPRGHTTPSMNRYFNFLISNRYG